MTIGLLCLGLTLVLAMLRIPLAISLLTVSLGGLTWFYGPTLAGSMLTMTIKEASFSYELAVLPMFVLMGNIISTTGISHHLFRAANAFLGARRGGLASATMVSCAGFAAVCGSSIATAATMSRVAFPSMKAYGYSDSLASATIAAGGTLGILIPPSTILVLYGLLTETSIPDLFIAGIGPGLLGLALYLAVVWLIAWRRPDLAPSSDPVSWREKMQSLAGVWPFAALFLLIIGGMYLRIFTATEAAGIGAGCAILIALVQRRLTWAILRQAFIQTLTTSVMLYMVLFGAMLLAKLILVSGIGEEFRSALLGSGLSYFQILICILTLFLVLGCVMDSVAIILICVPLFVPVIAAAGYDLIWFGILVVVATEIGLITPPVGMNVFVLKSCLPGVRMAEIYRGLVPFIMVDILRLAILVALPAVALGLVQATH